MDLRAIIADIASRADDFLGDTPDRKHARAGIEEFITLEYADLEATARKTVVDGVMAVLEAEEFFGMEFVGDAFKDDEDETHE